MENQTSTSSLEEKVLETNLPVRKGLISKLETMLAEEKLDTADKVLNDIKEEWSSLGVPLQAEQELLSQYNQLCKDLEHKLEELQEASKSSKDSLKNTLSQIDNYLKNESNLNEDTWKDLRSNWENQKLEESDPQQQQFEKLEPKVIQKLKRQEHDEKCAILEGLIQELEELKTNRDKKLSERQNQIRAVRDKFKEINLHSGPNVVTLREKFDTLNQELTQELSWERWSSSKRKEDLITKASQLLDQGEAKNFREELQKLQNEWKEIGFTSRDDDKLWDQFKEKCDQVFQKLKTLQDENESKRENILKELDAFKDSNDWKKSTEQIQKLQKDWNDAYPVSRKAGRKQGQAYKEICDHFFNRRREHQKEIRASQKDNLKDKKLLIEQVIKLHAEPNWRHSLPKVKDIQEQWKKTGPVPKKISEPLWKEFQEACSVIYDKRRAENEVVDKEFEANAEKKKELLEKLKLLIEENDLTAVKTEMQKIEKQWLEAGKVPRNKQKSIEHEYRVCIKNLNDKEEQIKKEKHQQWVNLTQEKSTLCHEIELLLFEEKTDTTQQKFEDLKNKWNEMGTSIIEKSLKKRFHYCSQYFDSENTSSDKTEIEKLSASNKEKAEQEIIAFEKLVGIESQNLSASAQRQMMIAELQAKMGRSTHKVNKEEEAAKHLSELQSIGPLTKDDYQEIQTRIEAAFKKLN
jgi:hypothetical protein